MCAIPSKLYNWDWSESEGKRPKPTPLPRMRLWLKGLSTLSLQKSLDSRVLTPLISESATIQEFSAIQISGNK